MTDHFAFLYKSLRQLHFPVSTRPHYAGPRVFTSGQEPGALLGAARGLEANCMFSLATTDETSIVEREGETLVLSKGERSLYISTVVCGTHTDICAYRYQDLHSALMMLDSRTPHMEADVATCAARFLTKKPGFRSK